MTRIKRPRQRIAAAPESSAVVSGGRIIASLLGSMLGAALLTSACSAVTLDEVLANKQCGPAGECAEGYFCNPSSNLCLPDGTPSGGGGQGGAGGVVGGGDTGGAGGDGPCQSVSECPVSSPCEIPTCVGGVCGSTAVLAGTPLPEAVQIDGDCSFAICDGAGNVSQLNDDEDLPADGQECTEDTCVSGEPSNPPLDIGTPCEQSGGALCDALGACVECNAVSDCTGLPPGDECRQRACDGGDCGEQLTAIDTPVTIQIQGDCELVVCDGAGGTQDNVDPSDTPDDSNECTIGNCNGGVPGQTTAPAGTACGSGLQCDAAGLCVGCTDASECPGSDDFCRQRTCAGSVCGFDFTPADTPLPLAQQTSGDCQALVCDGSGVAQVAAEDGDTPSDDGIECTDESCVNGVPQHPPSPFDSLCSESGGVVCDGNGACVACNAPHQCDQGGACQSATCNGNSCGLVNTPSGTPAPGALQTEGDCTEVQCDGGGGTTDVADAADLPDDLNDCTADSCNGTVPVHDDLPSGTPCGNGGTCDGTGQCSVTKPNGDPCSAPAECTSGFCVDGRCCDGVCSGVCEACSMAKTGGSNGVCSSILPGQDPDDECPGEQLCNGSGACATTCGHLWSLRAGDDKVQTGHGLAIDSAGGILLAGRFRGLISFGNGPNIGAAANDVYLAKLDAAGGHLWSQGFGSGGSDRGYAVAAEGSSALHLVGEFAQTVDFGGGGIVSGGSTDVFIAEYDGGGGHLASAGYGNNKAQLANDVAVNGAGRTAVAGEFVGQLEFGGNVLNAGGSSSDAFVVSFEPNGIHAWSRGFGAGDDDRAHGVAIDSVGNVVVVGEFRETVNFGGGNLTAPGSNNTPDIFVVKLGPTGNHLWSHNFGANGADRGRGVAIDTSGNVYLTGEFRNTVDFGDPNGPLSAANRDVFLLKLDTNGNTLWARGFGGTDADRGWDVAVNGNNQVALVGHFSSTVDFGGGPFISAGGTDGFFAKYDANGVHICSRRFGASLADEARAVAFHPAGGVVVTGDFLGSVDFGSGTPLVSAGSSDVFVARYGD